MNTIKKLSAILALAFVAHEGSASSTVPYMTGTEIDAVVNSNTTAAEALLNGSGTEFVAAFPSSTAQHQTLAVLTPLNITQADVSSAITPTGSIAANLGHFTQSNTASGSAAATNLGSTFTNSMSTNTNTTVDQSTGADTTNVYDGTTTDTV
jgi:hypothetical protein